MNPPRKLGLALLLTGVTLAIAYRNTHGDVSKAPDATTLPWPAPGIVRSEPPAYPEAAMKAGIQGTVVVRVDLRRDGTVRRARIVRSIPALDAAALEAVRKWVFRTKDERGRALPMSKNVPVKFALHGPAEERTVAPKHEPLRDDNTIAPHPDPGGVAPKVPVYTYPSDTTVYPTPGEYDGPIELPEAIHRVPPVTPEAAKRAGIHGTMLVQAYVRTDGTVGETRISRSIPGLDGAAVACVRQWRFKPAVAAGNKRVSVWVAIPIRFE